ncbi:MAG: site-specific DNA-methyltransferase [Sediminibacterium sp.]|nr:site-specific DNA-methyltransferase [Sediminibacterium sp.]
MDKKIDIRNGDALELFKTIKDNCIDLIVADPPYNLNKDYGNQSDSKTFAEYIQFTEDWTREAKRVLKPTGTIYVFMGFRFISYLYQILEKSQKLHFNNWICWYYTQGIGKTKGFSARHDDILMFTKTEKFTFNLDDIRVPQKFYRSVNNMRGANPGDVWEFSHIHYCQENRQNHPTQKPEGLIERMVLASSNIGDTVLDPFSGSGTTIRVCQQLNRNCIGFELNSEYVQMTEVRLKIPFTGFDSIDPRMERLPNDLNNDKIREEYLLNHIEWFLKNHNEAIDVFYKEVEAKYGHKIAKQKQKISSTQKSLFDYFE